MNWHDAQTYCQSLHENTYLAEIYDEYSFRMISETLDTLILEFDWTMNWWLGGSDILKVTTFANETQKNHQYMVSIILHRKGIGRG